MNRQPDLQRRAGVLMRASIGVAAVLLVVLLVLGWGASAWRTAVGVLFLACIGVCVWAGVMSEQSSREVRTAAQRLAETRAQARSTASRRDRTSSRREGPR